eukprot:11592589-Heterocapsa_arctica.AAC.1
MRWLNSWQPGGYAQIRHKRGKPGPAKCGPTQALYSVTTHDACSCGHQACAMSPRHTVCVSPGSRARLFITVSKAVHMSQGRLTHTVCSPSRSCV